MCRASLAALASALAVATLAACPGEVPRGRPDAPAAPGGADAPPAPAADAPPGPPGPPDARPGADAPPPGTLLGAYQLTYYWVAAEDDHPGPADTDLYDDACDVLATVSADFADALALEGTGRLRDGRLLNYDGPCGCPRSPCFFELGPAYPWGAGAASRPLVPFRSVAVDTDLIAIGTGLWIAELDGVTMPGEPPWGAFVHDGCVTADDVGGGIQGEHLDFFAALREGYEALDGALGLSRVTLHRGGARCP